MEGETNFPKRLKRFDGLTWLDLTPIFYDWSTPLFLSLQVCPSVLYAIGWATGRASGL